MRVHVLPMFVPASFGNHVFLIFTCFITVGRVCVISIVGNCFKRACCGGLRWTDVGAVIRVCC